MIQYKGFIIEPVPASPGWTWAHPDAEDDQSQQGFAMTVAACEDQIRDHMEDKRDADQA